MSIHHYMLSLLSCISYRQVYLSRERESSLAILCVETLKRREEKKERDCGEVRSRNFVTPLLNIIKTKFLWM